MGIKVLIVSTLHGMHVYIRGKMTDFPLRKEDLPVQYLSYRCIKEKRISWVATSVGILVINEGIMLGCIHAKILSFMCTDLGS
jgi:hypothetical protein